MAEGIECVAGAHLKILRFHRTSPNTLIYHAYAPYHSEWHTDSEEVEDATSTSRAGSSSDIESDIETHRTPSRHLNSKVIVTHPIGAVEPEVRGTE